MDRLKSEWKRYQMDWLKEEGFILPELTQNGCKARWGSEYSEYEWDEALYERVSKTFQNYETFYIYRKIRTGVVMHFIDFPFGNVSVRFWIKIEEGRKPSIKRGAHVKKQGERNYSNIEKETFSMADTQELKEKFTLMIDSVEQLPENRLRFLYKKPEIKIKATLEGIKTLTS